MDPKHPQNEYRIGDDLIAGGPAIAAELGESTRRAYYLLEAGLLPGFRIGRRWYVRRTSLVAFIDRLERGNIQ